MISAIRNDLNTILFDIAFLIGIFTVVVVHRLVVLIDMLRATITEHIDDHH